MDNKIDKKKIRENVAAFIKKKREDRGWTAVQVIDIAAQKHNYEIKPPYLSRWENGVSSIPIEALSILCKIYGVSVIDAYGMEKAQHQSPFEKDKLNAALMSAGVDFNKINKLSESQVELIVQFVKELANTQGKN